MININIINFSNFDCHESLRFQTIKSFLLQSYYHLLSTICCFEILHDWIESYNIFKFKAMNEKKSLYQFTLEIKQKFEDGKVNLAKMEIDELDRYIQGLTMYQE